MMSSLPAVVPASGKRLRSAAPPSLRLRFDRQLLVRPWLKPAGVVMAVALTLLFVSLVGKAIKDGGAPAEVQILTRGGVGNGGGNGVGSNKVPAVGPSDIGSGPVPSPPSSTSSSKKKKNTKTVVCADYCADFTERQGLNDDELVATVLTIDGEDDDSYSGYLKTNVDVLNRNDLVQIVRQKKKEYITKQLHKYYGAENFDNIFLYSQEDRSEFPYLHDDDDDGDDVGRTYRPFMPAGSPNGTSVRSLRRKLMIKVLSAQIAMKEHAEILEKCKCPDYYGNNRKDLRKQLRRQLMPAAAASSSGGRGRRRAARQQGTAAGGQFERYVWATGGHSASAGHGNLFNESYTAVMERHVWPIFGAIGIDFEARNYAMGGTASAPEMSMCFDQIYGTDVDIFSWDFGMTDGNDFARMLQYGYRGGTSPGRAAMVGMCVDDKFGTWKSLEGLGMPVFYGHHMQCNKMREAIPDSAHLPFDQLGAMPDLVRNYKCDGAIERGEPLCDSEKYSKLENCQRSGAASWHPGWKEHALHGHSLVLFLTDMLLGAVEELADDITDDDETLLNMLLEEEEVHHRAFLDAPLPDVHTTMYRYNNSDPDEGQPVKLDSSRLFKGPTLCHTARLPAQTRYLGHLTNTNLMGEPAPAGQETYFVGVDERFALTTPSDGDMRLSYDPGARMQCPAVPVSPDYKDAFLTTTTDGWNRLTIPNEAEKKAYLSNEIEFQGTIVVVWRGCDWGNCEPGFLKPETYQDKMFEMKVNGVPVTALVHIGQEAHMLESEEGHNFAPNSDGTYTIEIIVNEPSSFVKISTFMLT